jgi:acyl carrier protein
MTSNESVVIKILGQILRWKDLPAAVLAPGTVLDSQLGLESIDFAELVVRLEEATGKDPFADGTPPQIQTISDLAALYDSI